MTEKIIYSFTLEAKSPLSFGSLENDPDMVVMNTDTIIKISGNSIGGALREYLKQGDDEDKKATIIAYMGGVEQEGSENSQQEELQQKELDIAQSKDKFIESSIYISDATLQASKIETQEGTSINPKTGTASKHKKYTFKSFPRGTKLSFTIECDVENGKPVKKNIKVTFDELVKNWAIGFHKGDIRLGGRKSNGMGLFKVAGLEKKVFSFNNAKAIEEYIFHRGKLEYEKVDLTFLPEKNENNSTINFTLNGSFPYRVYQAFHDDSLSKKEKVTVTGLQKEDDQYYIPATSIKGLLRHEVSLLIQQLSACESTATAKCGELFGDTGQQGKLRFVDVFIGHSKQIRIEREAKGSSTLPVYNKIDRLTGGALDKALKHQNEVIGEAKIDIELRDEGVPLEDNPYVFPLVYVLRRIGSGKVPIGGRTVIGLGEFKATQTTVTQNNKTQVFPNLTYSEELEDNAGQQPLEFLSDKPDAVQLLEKSFKSFERWVKDET